MRPTTAYIHGSKCTDNHGLSYTRDQLLCFQAAPLGPSLTSHLRELSIWDRFSRKSSSRGGRRKQRRIAVVCCAAREPEAKRWLKVMPCDPCPASLLPSPPPSQTPTVSFFPSATLPSYIPPPPPSTTSPPPCWFPGVSLLSYIPPPSPSTTSSPPTSLPPCWFPGASLPSYISPPPPFTTSSPPISPPPCWFPGATLLSYAPPPSMASPPPCWFPGATLLSYRPPPSTTSPPPCWFPGATLPSYRHPPLQHPRHCAHLQVRHCCPTDHLLSLLQHPLHCCFPVLPNTLATTWQASVNSDNLVTLTVPHKATYPTGNSGPAQNSLRLAYFNAQSCRQKASEINI